MGLLHCQDESKTLDYLAKSHLVKTRTAANAGWLAKTHRPCKWKVERTLTLQSSSTLAVCRVYAAKIVNQRGRVSGTVDHELHRVALKQEQRDGMSVDNPALHLGVDVTVTKTLSASKQRWKRIYLSGFCGLTAPKLRPKLRQL
jgi:hypothetical protein